jgi:hypothetical protein
MSTATIISSELMARMQAAADKAAAGIRDSDAMDRAFAEMDRLREDLRQKIGTVDVAVDLIRDARDR